MCIYSQLTLLQNHFTSITVNPFSDSLFQEVYATNSMSGYLNFHVYWRKYCTHHKSLCYCAQVSGEHVQL
jgi:hypothetical protein